MRTCGIENGRFCQDFGWNLESSIQKVPYHGILFSLLMTDFTFLFTLLGTSAFSFLSKQSIQIFKVILEVSFH